ncbi:MAG: hypothetical protein Kow0037_28780 [Calditrichia bacterium]
MNASLYDRLGQRDGIERIVRDAVNAHLNNPIVKTRYENTDDLEHAIKMSIDFFCAGSGGPQEYHGRDMLETHKGMNVSEQEFIEVVDDILGALKKNNVKEAEQQEVLAILYSLKGQIIRV